MKLLKKIEEGVGLRKAREGFYCEFVRDFKLLIAHIKVINGHLSVALKVIYFPDHVLINMYCGLTILFSSF